MIPERIRVFLRATIKSVWALDLLVLLKSAPGREWTVGALNDSLRASTSLVEEILDGFARRGLVAADGKGLYRYAPATAEMEAIAGDLVRLYAERPLAVIKEVVSAPNEKIHSFVDAFRLKKD